jgi:hypothetical protein
VAKGFRSVEQGASPAGADRARGKSSRHKHERGSRRTTFSALFRLRHGEWQRQWDEANPDKVHRFKRKWHETNKDKVKAYKHRRRVLARGADADRFAAPRHLRA